MSLSDTEISQDHGRIPDIQLSQIPADQTTSPPPSGSQHESHPSNTRSEKTAHVAIASTDPDLHTPPTPTTFTALEHPHPRPSISSHNGGHPAQHHPPLHPMNTLALSRCSALALLISASLLVAVCANFLVGTIGSLTSPTSTPHTAKISQAAISLIILPLVGNAAEHITALTVTLRGKFDLALDVALGSAIQVALFISPLMVLVGWCTGKEGMTLYFGLFETVVLMGSGVLVGFVVWSGRMGLVEGGVLCACYVLVG